MGIRLPAAFVLAAVWAAGAGAGELHAELVAGRTPTPPVVDGEMDEVWRRHSVPYEMGYCIGGIDNRIVERYLTHVRLLWDDDCLYALFIANDTDTVATLTRRDDPVYREEMCEAMLRPPGRETLYEVSVSPTNVVYDARARWDDLARLAVEPGFDLEGFRSATARVELGPGRLVWRVEMAIPWRALDNFAPRPGMRLAGNFLRYERIRNGSDGAPGREESLMMGVFPTHIRGWPAATASLRPIVLSPAAADEAARPAP